MSQPHEKFSLSEITEQTHGLAGTIRDYAREQLPIWQLVPGLAMEIALREEQGLLSRIDGAYMANRWTVFMRSTGMPSPVLGLPTMEWLDVDLNTGEIVHSGKDVSDDEVLKLAPDLQSLDAVHVVESMVERISAFDSTGRKRRFGSESSQEYFKRRYGYLPVDLNNVVEKVNRYKEQSTNHQS